MPYRNEGKHVSLAISARQHPTIALKCRNVGRHIFGFGSVAEADIVQKRRGNTQVPLFLVDSFFETNMDYLENLPSKSDLSTSRSTKN